jgi:hypothetical protein
MKYSVRIFCHPNLVHIAQSFHENSKTQILFYTCICIQNKSRYYVGNSWSIVCHEIVKFSTTNNIYHIWMLIKNNHYMFNVCRKKVAFVILLLPVSIRTICTCCCPCDNLMNVTKNNHKYHLPWKGGCSLTSLDNQIACME